VLLLLQISLVLEYMDGGTLADVLRKVRGVLRAPHTVVQGKINHSSRVIMPFIQSACVRMSLLHLPSSRMVCLFMRLWLPAIGAALFYVITQM
jgi:hypothetical protein